jgi:hypothetical protein
MRKALFLLVVPALLAGCGGDDQGAKPRARAKPKPEPLTLEVGASSRKVTTNPTVTIRGRVTSGATVTAGQKAASVHGVRFRVRVRLKVGVNRVRLTARKQGFLTSRKVVRYKRAEPPPVTTPAQTVPQAPPQQDSGAPQPNGGYAQGSGCPAGQSPSRPGSGVSGCVPECGAEANDSSGCGHDAPCPAGEVRANPTEGCIPNDE